MLHFHMYLYFLITASRFFGENERLTTRVKGHIEESLKMIKYDENFVSFCVIMCTPALNVFFSKLLFSTFKKLSSYRSKATILIF